MTNLLLLFKETSLLVCIAAAPVYISTNSRPYPHKCCHLIIAILIGVFGRKTFNIFSFTFWYMHSTMVIRVTLLYNSLLGFLIHIQPKLSTRWPTSSHPPSCPLSPATGDYHSSTQTYETNILYSTYKWHHKTTWYLSFYLWLVLRHLTQ